MLEELPTLVWVSWEGVAVKPTRSKKKIKKWRNKKRSYNKVCNIEKAVRFKSYYYSHSFPIIQKKKALQGFSQILLLSLNDCSLGFYRISDHIHRKVPRIVETKRRLKQSSKRVEIAISDIEDVRKNVCDIERIESFYNINKMIERSIQILHNSNSSNNNKKI